MLLKVSMTVSQCKIIAINAQSHSVDANPPPPPQLLPRWGVEIT